MANSTPGADTISFASGLSGTITLTSQLDVNDAVTINGPGFDQLILSGGGNSRTFQFVGGGANLYVLQGLTLENGESGAAGGAAILTATGDLPNTNPQLSPLQDNGGPTRTHTLLPGSPAIDHSAVDLIPILSYELNNSLAETNGGAALVANGGTLVGGGYRFEPNQGLVASSPTINAAEYSIELLFSFDTVSDFRKVIDFKGLTEDAGLYVRDGRLNFFGAGNGQTICSALVRPNVQYHLELTRDAATKQVRATINGVEAIHFIDSPDLAVAGGIDPTFNLFTDDTPLVGGEASGGFVSSIYIYDSVLDDARIAASFDQRGPGFTRVIGGRIDIGSIELQAPAVSLDFGDAPLGYPVTLAQDGARHAVSGLFLGTSIDGEPDGVNSIAADSDDNVGADEDGVFVIATLISAAVPTSNSFQFLASAADRLDAWIDFNGNGSWLDAGEQIFTSRIVAAGSNILNFTVPVGAATGDTGARFRLSTAGGLAPTGAALDGEVEDYIARIVTASDTAVLEVFSPEDLVQKLAFSNQPLSISERTGVSPRFQRDATDLAIQDFSPPRLRAMDATVTDTATIEAIDDLMTELETDVNREGTIEDVLTPNHQSTGHDRAQHDDQHRQH